MKSGTEYELLVQSIYGKLIRNTNINYKKTNIQHNIKLKGKKTGLDHQIDVYCEFTMYDGKVYKYAVECKDYASKLEKNKIAAFWGILDDLVDVRGIYVCKNGYQSGALTYAKTYGISVMEIRHPTEKDLDGRIQDIVLSVIITSPTVICTNLFIDYKWLEVQYGVGILVIKGEQGGKVKFISENINENIEFTLADILELDMKKESMDSAVYKIDKEFDNTYLISNGEGSITLGGKNIDRIKVNGLHVEYTYKDELFAEYSMFGKRVVDVIAKNALTGQIAFCDSKGNIEWVDN